MNTENTSSATAQQPAFFLGRYDHALDPKKRLTIPSCWRDCLGNPKYVFVLPDAGEKCLVIMPYEEMQEQLGQLRKRAYFDPSLTAALRVIGANSEQVSFDVQGRIRISDRLLKYAGLAGKVALVGAVNRIQIWAPETLPEADEVDSMGLHEAFRTLQP